MALITVDEAKEHLNVTHDDDDVKIGELCEEASDIMLDYIKADEADYYDTSGDVIEGALTPTQRAAVMLILGSLYDNADGQDPDKNPLSQAVKDLLHRKRDPTLA